MNIIYLFVFFIKYYNIYIYKIKSINSKLVYRLLIYIYSYTQGVYLFSTYFNLLLFRKKIVFYICWPVC